MISRFLRPGTLATCIATCLIAGGLTTQTAFAGPALRPMISANAATLANGTQRYIVRFKEAPLALHNRELRSSAQGQQQAKAKLGGSTTLSSVGQIPLRMKANGRVGLDAQSPQAIAYRTALSTRQDAHQASIEAALGRSVKTTRRFQNAFNGAVMELKPNEVEKLLRVDGVASVQAVREVVPMDDLSSRLIGASSIWIGAQDSSTAPFASLDQLFADLNGKTGFRGDGIVVGDIDTGYNSASPSFAATDGSGYTHTNPLGTGKFIGDCGVDGISVGGCNDKVIGVFDEFNTTNGDAAVSVEDVNGHGSHTSSTQVGNARHIDIQNFGANISGIAPHANLVFFGICPTGTGCTDAAILGSVEDAIKSGVVDTLNLSFGNGNGYEPDYWVDNKSLAFLAATEAGIFVSQSAGNTQAANTALGLQSPGTTGNDAPWVMTVAATTTAGGAASPVLSLTGPGTPPAAAQNVPTTEATFDTPLGAALPASTPIVLSPQFDAADLTGTDGCSGYPAAVFTGSIALISRGTCGFAVKVPNAIAAGAIAVIIGDNRLEGAFSPTVGPPQVGVPVFSISQAAALAAKTFLAGNNNLGTASLGYPNQRPAQQADVLAGFSLIGPALVGGGVYPFNNIATPVIDVIKPDIAAPGVAILAALNNETPDDANGNATTPNGADFVGFDSGTSMASPHIASSGALILGVHPDWTPMEVKSALMMTATTAVTEADAKTPATPLDVGSGRVQVYQATLAGLVLDESVDNLAAADPVNGGDPSTLNLASMQNSKCGGSCTFTRTFTSTQKSSLNWVVSASGELGSVISANPSSFTVDAGKSVDVTFTVNTARLGPNTGYHFGTVSLTTAAPANPAPTVSPVLHLPVAIAVPDHNLAATSNVVNIALNGKATGSASLTLSNTGSGTMVFTPKSTGSASIDWLNQPSNLGYNSFTAVHYTSPGTGDKDFYLADDFTLTGNSVNLSSIVAAGFTNGGTHALSAFGSSLPLHWRIYADNNGLPASDPLSGDNAVWKYDATAGSPGVSVLGDTISLNLVAAQLQTALPAGHYWLAVYPELPCNDTDGNGCTEGWYWSTSWTGSGATWASTATGFAWDNEGNTQYGPGLALTIATNAACSAPPSWLTFTPNGGTGSVDSGNSAVVNFNATAAGYAPATSASTYVCFAGSYQEPSLFTLIPKNFIPVQVNVTN